MSSNSVFHKGFTLLEVLITIVVIAIAASALMGVYVSTVKTSVDPMIQQQAIAIAEAYMEEIQLKNFADPTQLESGGAEAGETRMSYDDVQDYDDPSIDGAVADQNNNAIGSLSDYSVTVAVSGQTLGGTPVIPVTDSMRIDITVDHPAIDPITLSGFRTLY